MRAEWFCIGFLAGMVYCVFASWLGGVLARRSNDYAPEVPLTRDELAARREKLANSLINASHRRAQ